MTKYLLTSVAGLFFLLFASSALAAPSIGGLQLGDTEASLKTISLKLLDSSQNVPNGPAVGYRYATKNNNALAVTFKGGHAVWIENDWYADPDSADSLLNGFVFGKTTLNDIRAIFGSDGYSFKSMVFHKIGDYEVTFNCYELADAPGSSIVFVTKIPLGTAPKDVDKYGGDAFKLEGIVLANDDYMSGMWGKDQVQDPTYRTISWESVAKAANDTVVSTLKRETDIGLSTIATTTEDFSIILPAGFHSVAPPTGTTGFYVFQDAADSHRELRFVVEIPPNDKGDSAGYLDFLLHGYAAIHDTFEHTAASPLPVNGVNYLCSDWTGTKGNRTFGGLLCAAMQGDRRLTFSVLDLASRYRDDEVIYRKSLESLKLK